MLAEVVPVKPGPCDFGARNKALERSPNGAKIYLNRGRLRARVRCGYLGVFMLRTGHRLSLILWGVPLLAACSVAQTPVAQNNNVFRPGMQVMGPNGARPPARFGATPLHAAPIPAPAPTGTVPVPMSQLAATPPQVSYQGGMLTIVAENSNLGDILREVHRLTGATIDVPSNATERVVTHLGPGPARDVLADLLNGSTFNYVMLGTESDPASLSSVMLTMKPAGGNAQTAANVYQPPPQTYAVQQGIMPPGAGPGGPVVQQPASDDEADADDKDEDDSADEAQGDQAQNGATPAADGSQPNPGPKTPEQILEMLRQRQGQIAPGQQMIPKPTPPDDNSN